jgi:hypothetical protein
MGVDNEKNPFNVAAAIKHPISLGAAAVIAVTVILKAFLEMDVFPQLSGDQAFALLNRALTYIFVLAVIVLIAVLVITYLKEDDSGGEQQPVDTGLPPASGEPEPVTPPVDPTPQPRDPPLPPPPAGDVDTGGGAYVGGDVDTGGGDFVGRDQINE